MKEKIKKTIKKKKEGYGRKVIRESEERDEKQKDGIVVEVQVVGLPTYVFHSFKIIIIKETK